MLYVEGGLLSFDQDVYGRGVLEMKSIYHLGETVMERLQYIRVSGEASIHPGDECLNTQIKTSLVTHHPQHQD